MVNPKLALIPSAYKAGTLYSPLPTNGDGDFTFSRNSVATRVKKDGLIEEVAIDTPRLDYSDGGCPSLLLEPSRTNYVQNQNVNSYAQNLADVTLSDSVSPDGSINCFRVEGTSSGLRVGIATFATTIGNTYTGSVYVRKVSGSDTAQIVDVDFASPTTINITTEWQRFDITRTATQTTGRIFVNVSQIGDVIEVFGFQLEEGSYATSYIPTNGSIATRNTDLCVNSGNANVFNDNEGVLFVETKAFADLDDNRYMMISDGAFTPYTNHIIFQYRTDGALRVYVGGLGGSNIAFIVSSIDLSENHKIAFQYKLNDNKLFIDGIEQSPYAPFVETTLSGLNNLSFALNNNVNFTWRATVKDARYYDTVLTDAELTELTTI